MNRCSGKIVFTVIIVLLFVLSVQASSAAINSNGPYSQWVKEYPVEEIEILSVCESSDGGYYAAGAGPEGRIVMKIDAEGNTLWKKYIPGSDENGSIKMVKESPAGGLILFADGEDLIKTTDEAEFEWEFHQPVGKVYSIDVAPDGSGLMAGTYFQGFLTDVAPNGTEAWNKSFSNTEGGGQIILRSVQNDLDGGFIIGGYINPILMVVDYSGFLMKTDSEGEMIWARQYPDNASGMIVSVACRPSGGYAAARLQTLVGADNSSFSIPSVMFTDAEGEIESLVEYDESVSYIYHVDNAGDDGYYLTGVYFVNGSVNDEYKVLRTDLSGNLLWEKNLGNLTLNGFSVTSDGGFIVAGVSYDGNNSLLVKYPDYPIQKESPVMWIVSLAAIFFAVIYMVSVKRP